MKNYNVKPFIIFFVANFISSANLLTYSLLSIYFSGDNIWWMIWSFSHYFVYCFALYEIEKITFDLPKYKKYLFRIVMISLLAIELIVGFFISTFDEMKILPIALIVFFCLLSSALIVCGLYCHKLECKREKEDEDNTPKRDINDDLELFYTKRLTDENGKNGVKVGFSLICVSVVYICVLAVIIFANVVCKRVTPIYIAVACFLSAIAVAANEIQIVLTSKKIFIETLIENGLLIVALVGYLIVEWIFIKVTFNFILCLSFILLLIPIHLKFGRLTKAFNNTYK